MAHASHLYFFSLIEVCRPAVFIQLPTFPGCLFLCYFLFFFFNHTATTEIYTLSLHDALPIWATGGEIGVAVWALQSNVLSELVVGKENDVTQGTRVLVMKKQMPAELGRRLENKRWRAQCALDSHGF